MNGQLLNLFVLLCLAQGVPDAKPTATSTGPRILEAIFVDQSTLKVQVDRESIDLNTRYGKLAIPLRDVQRIEFGRRVPSDVAKQVDAAIADLGSAQFQAREAAGERLVQFGVHAYAAVARAAKGKDPEVATRAEKVLDKLHEQLPPEVLDVPEEDVVYTAESKITGRIEGDESWPARTSQFGQVRLRLADLRRLAIPEPKESPELKNALPDPGTLAALGFQVVSIGKTYTYRVKGSVEGPVWGTDTYTVDSTLAAAAVHAGVLRPGQTGAVKIEMVGIHRQYEGSTRNGVESQPFPAFPGFRFVPRLARGQ
jgi:hypothetical protein